jgi:hypothetical protein
MRYVTMRSLVSGLGLGAVLLAGVTAAHAQKATEQFIPIGQSPGASQRQTSIGEIVEADARALTLTIAEPAGRRTVKLTDKTRIFLDRSKLKQPNLEGTVADLQKGRRVEVKYIDPERREVADWVKVEIAQP